jgi:hypothetical protein
MNITPWAALPGAVISASQARCAPCARPAGRIPPGGVDYRAGRRLLVAPSWPPFSVVGSSGDELLAAVDVVGGAGERGVGHDVDGERGDVGGADDAADRKCCPQLVAPLLELVAEQ